MTMYTPPENRGQIVDISYGWCDGNLYRRVRDRSDSSTQWYRATDETEINAYVESGSESWNEEPSVKAWTACDHP